MNGLSDSFIPFCAAATSGATLHGPLKSHLATLTLDGNPIGDSGLKALADAARDGALRSVTRLSFAGCNISGKGLGALAAVTIDVAPSLGSLRELNLYRNNVGASGTDILCQELARGAFQGLHALYLGSNALGSEGCETLAVALQASVETAGTAVFAQLRRLHLYDNDIGKEGAMAIGKVLHRDTFDEASGMEQPFVLPACRDHS